MSRRRSISDIVAVIMLVIIAIAAAAVIYAWLSGLLGGIRSSSSSVTAVKLDVTSASVFTNSTGTYVTVSLVNPPNSPPTSVALIVVELYNGTVIGFAGPQSPIPVPTSSAKVITLPLTTAAKVSIPSGSPIKVIVYTTSGYYMGVESTWP